MSAPGKALPLAGGLSGGLPAGTQHDVLLRGTTIQADLAGGHIPSTLAELGGAADLLPAHHETDLGPTDVYFTHWQGGGGLRRPAAARARPQSRPTSSRTRFPSAAADEVYGVVLGDDGHVDVDATTSRRASLRRSRAGLDDDRQEVTA